MKYSTVDDIVGIIEFSDTIIKSRKVKLILWIIFSFLSVASFLFVHFLGFSFLKVTVLTLALLGLLIVSILTLRFYNWPLILFLFVFIGMCYRRVHWTYAEPIMGLGTVLLGSIAWFNIFKFYYTFRNNTFLKWFGCLSGMIVILVMLGLLFKNSYWSGASTLFFSGCFVFIISVLAFVFTLPNSNYIAWSGIERKVFFRTVLAPMIFVFALITLFLVFSNTYNTIMGRGIFHSPWFNNITEIKLFDLEGIPAI